MPFPQHLNFDIVAHGVLQDIASAIKEWSAGQPRSEEAFMNQITGRLSRRRRGCDVGLQQPVGMRCQMALLHRRGASQTDQFGSDLAITIFVDNDRYVKTALFQLKKSDSYRATIERSQLDQSLSDQRTRERAYVLAVDETRQGIRIEKASHLLDQFDNQETKLFDASRWTSLTQWIWNWFSCDTGPMSDPDDSQSIEAVLDAYRIPGEEEWQSPWAVGEVSESGLPETIPARAWLALLFGRMGRP